MSKLFTFLGGLGCVCTLWGIIWGIFLRGFLWLAFAGLILMGIASLFLEEE